jgi:hypothetical protein
VRPDEAVFVQKVEFLPRQGPASRREASVASWKVTTRTKRTQRDRQAATKVKRLSPVKFVERMPTVCSFGKAPVGVGYGDCAGESAGVGERGMSGDGWIAELGRSLAVS